MGSESGMLNGNFGFGIGEGGDYGAVINGEQEQEQ